MSISNSFKDLAGGDLDVFTPKPQGRETPSHDAKRLEHIAEEHGFTVDNMPITRKLLKSGRVASRDKAQPMTLRIRVADWNRFSAFCERNGYTVAEGFEKLSLLSDDL